MQGLGVQGGGTDGLSDAAKVSLEVITCKLQQTYNAVT